MGHPTLFTPLALAASMLLFSPSALAFKTDHMRPSTNVEDRRMEPTEAAEELDRSSGIFYTISKQAEAGQGMFICEEMKKYQGRFRILGAELKKAPRAVPMLESAKAADLKADTSNVDACDGAMRAQIELTDKALFAADTRKRKFEKGYESALPYTLDLEAKVKEINQTVGPNCGSLTRPLERKLKDFNNAYENLENHFRDNVTQLRAMNLQLIDRFVGSGCNGGASSAVAQGNDEPMVIKVKPRKKAPSAPKRDP